MKKQSLSFVCVGAGAFFLAAGALGVSSLSNKDKVFFAEGETCAHVGNHYSAIAAGESTPGVKEYYACCKCLEKYVVNYTDAGAYTLDDGANSTEGRAAPSGLIDHARWPSGGNTLGFWENDCGYVKFANPISIASNAVGAKMRLSIVVKADSWYDKTVSLYPLTATDWSTNRVDVPVEVSSSGESNVIEIPLTGVTSFIVDGKLPGFFISAPLLSWLDTSTNKYTGNKGCYITVNGASVFAGAPAGTWTDATLAEEVKTAVEADPTDVRYLAPAFNKTTLTGYTLCLGSDSDPDGNPETSDARTCPSGLWSSMRAGGITDNKTFGIWGGDCGYVKFATPLTVTTGSRLDISLTIACSGAFSNKVSVYPLGATSWDKNRVDLVANTSGDTTVSLTLTGSPTFVVSGTVPGFFFATPLMSWGAAQSPAVDDIGASVTINSIDLFVANN